MPGGGLPEDTLAAARRGEEAALRVLFKAYQPRLLRFLRALEPRAADDLAAEVWLAVAERLATFVGGEVELRAWLFSIARRRVADHRRRAARRPAVALPPDQLPVAADPLDAADVAVDRLSAQEAIDVVAAHLPDEQAEIILLRVVAGLSADEVAAITGRPPGTVRVMQHRALRRLAQVLEARGVTP